MYTTSPSWSMPGKCTSNYHLDNAEQHHKSPSPSLYHPDQWNSGQTPCWKMGTDARSKMNSEVKPGPGYYEVNSKTISTKFGKFDKENHHKINVNHNPAPNKYSPNFKYNTPTTPCSSIAKKYKQNRGFNVPGPGLYHTQSINKFHQHNIKIGGQKRFFTQKNQGPGPQTYSPSKDNFKTVHVGFSRDMKHSSHYQSQIPGPGSYAYRDNFITSLKEGKGYSMSLKAKQSKQNFTPGPGQYDPVNCSKPESPKISMKGKFSDHKPYKTPGPNQYLVKSGSKKQHGGFSIGKSERGSVNLNTTNPGPGSYNPVQFFKQNPKFSLNGSRHQQKANQSPGPGAYNPDKNYVKKRPQSAKIGKSFRGQKLTSDVPGPGSYILKPRPTTSSLFTKEDRNKNNLQRTPGPGDYQCTEIFGHTQAYYRKV